MSLREEMPSKEKQVYFHPIDQAAHDEVDAQIKAFLKRGGTISQVPQGKSAYQVSRKQTKNRPVIQPTTRAAQNIIERKKGGKSHYVVKLMHEYFGSSENWTFDEATTNRDRIRKQRGLPPAEY